ncbi:MAG: DNA polymerase III subunit gamma/tau [Deltaproteobacteria bacterium]|nr:DNA polymerase III subunit gamma/tau [Deltaproteobacteria bacterium]
MSYLVLARKFRPANFDEVVGQAHVTKTLANAIEMDRVAHGFLFSGVRGVGKTSLARILAKSLNCSSGPTRYPCGTCASCRSITDGTAVDVIEIDGASNNSVDDIRELRETIPYRPIIGKFKIYVIDEVHMLSVSAFNALLKTLEEPPPHVKFIFATTEAHKIPATIISRVQSYDFRRIPTAAINERIEYILEKEGIKAEKSAVAIVGKEAEGSMRDALSILDQVLASGEKNITAELVEDLLGVVGRQTYYDLCQAIIDGSPFRTLEIIREVDKQGFDIPVFTKGLLEHVRNVMVASLIDDKLGFLDLPDEEIENLKIQAKSSSRDSIHRIFKHVAEAYDEIARSQFPKMLLEAALARLADMGDLIPADALLKRIEQLQKAVMSGGGVKIENQALPVKKKSAELAKSPISAPDNHEPAVNKSVTQSVKPSDKPVIADGPDTSEKKDSDHKPKSLSSYQVSDKELTTDGWEKLLKALSKKMPAWSSLLERAILKPGSTYSRITLKFDHEDSFTLEQISSDSMRSAIEQELMELIHYSVKIVTEQGEVKDITTIAKEKLEIQEKQRVEEESARNHPVVRGFEASLQGKIERVIIKR